jgi:hypothetical protein
MSNGYCNLLASKQTAVVETVAVEVAASCWIYCRKKKVIRVLGLAVLGKLLITLIAFISEAKKVTLNYFCSLKRKTEISEYRRGM